MKNNIAAFKKINIPFVTLIVFITAIVSFFGFQLFSGADYYAPEIQIFGYNGYTEKDIDSLIDGIISFKINETPTETVQEWIDGELSDNAGITSEWYVLALTKLGEGFDFSRYQSALESYLGGRKIAGAVARQKYAMVLTALEEHENTFVSSTLEDSIGEQGIMSFIFGLHMLNNGLESSKYTAYEIVSALLDMRLSDGGWALSGNTSDTEVTSMAVQALSKYYNGDMSEFTINTEIVGKVKNAVDEALEFIAEKQLEDGGFSSFGTENAENSAQLILALSSIGRRADDKDFIKNGNSAFDAMLSFRLSDGSFCHVKGGESDKTATVQCLLALISMKNQLSGNGYIYDFTGKHRDEENLNTNTESIPTVTEANTETDFSEESSQQADSDVTESKYTDSESRKLDYKLCIYLIIFVLSAISCVILFVMKKRNVKNFAFIIIIAAALALITAVTNFQTVDEYYGGVTEKSNVTGKVTLSINCSAVAERLDSEFIPSDGTILPKTEFELSDGETVFDILVLASRKHSIQLESSGTVPGTNSMVYVSGINYLYEMQFGDMSGWTYKVNGLSPSVGCGSYTLSDGDIIEWIYVLGFDMSVTDK